MSKVIRIYSIADLKKIHHKSYKNIKPRMKKDTAAGCFCCVSFFKKDDIKETTDAGKTALCPACGIDSVLFVDKEITIDTNLLHQMQKRYFKAMEE